MGFLDSLSHIFFFGELFINCLSFQKKLFTYLFWLHWVRIFNFCCVMHDLLVAVALSCSMWDPVPQPQSEPRPPALGA